MQCTPAFFTSVPKDVRTQRFTGEYSVTDVYARCSKFPILSEDARAVLDGDYRPEVSFFRLLKHDYAVLHSDDVGSVR
jgi:hypothetical protein